MNETGRQITRRAALLGPPGKKKDADADEPRYNGAVQPDADRWSRSAEMFSNPERDEWARSVTDRRRGSPAAARSGDDLQAREESGDREGFGDEGFGEVDDASMSGEAGSGSDENSGRPSNQDGLPNRDGVGSDPENGNLVFRRFEYREVAPPPPSVARPGSPTGESSEPPSSAPIAPPMPAGSSTPATSSGPDLKPATADLKPAGSDLKAAAATDRRRPDPLMQSLVLLVTMALMLTAARFAVPRIVEEIRYGWARGELRAEYEAGTRGLHNVSLDTLNEAYQMVTSAVGPSVVHIDVERRRPEITETGTGRVSTAFIPTSDQGSGVVVDEAGHILTNRHVIAEGESIHVTLSDGRRLEGELIGTDPLTDLAVLKVDANRLFPIAWGNSDRCKVGSPVWAIGSPFGLDQTVTFGIVSGKHRMVRAASDASGRHGADAHYQDFMQSDVAVNPGNSGGPLVDSKGTLVGINTAIVGDTFQGVSFSIPSNVARQVFERIRETGRVERGWLGVSLVEVPDDLLLGEPSRVRGALIAAITSGDSPAAAAGLARGDVITHVGEAKIIDSAHLIRVIGGELGGATVEIHVRRDGESITIPVELGTRPEEIQIR